MEKTISIVAVVGLGLMGRNICVCLLMAGHHVIGYDNDTAMLSIARQQILDQLNAHCANEKSAAETMLRYEMTDQLNDLLKSELVLESIDEDTEKKKDLIQLLEGVVQTNVIIGSNTSAIPITTLQQGMKYPERLIGVHWGDPAHISRFMEITMGDHTDMAHPQVLFGLCKLWAKDPILVKKDIPGFIANRLMYALFREAIYLYDHGYASMEDIDKACTNDMGLWMGFAGPFAYMELTGVKSYHKVMQNLFSQLSNIKALPVTVASIMNQEKTSETSPFFNRTPDELLALEEKFMTFSKEIKILTDKYSDRN